MVVMDESAEFLNAFYFAALRAEKTGAGVLILAVIRPDGANHLFGVGNAIAEESEARFRAHYEVFKRWMEGKVFIEPEFELRYGEPVAELLSVIDAHKDIGVLVLGASSDRKGPGPLIQELVLKRGGSLPIPVTIVPEKLTREQIRTIT